MNSYPARGTHRFRVIALGTALLIGGAAGFAGGQTHAADAFSLHSSVETSGSGGGSADATRREAVDAAETEARGWPNFDSTSLGDKARVADAEPLPDYGHTANGRSIALIESKEASTGLAQGPTDALWPDFVVNPQLRSIWAVEDKEAPVELAGPPLLPF